jgi:hypothetical protein
MCLECLVLVFRVLGLGQLRVLLPLVRCVCFVSYV